jgi:hypothetical protein
VKIPFDVDAYVARCRSGSCLVCALVAGEPGAEHRLVHDDDEVVGFLARRPTPTFTGTWPPLPPDVPWEQQQIPRPDERNGVLGVDHAAQQALEASIRKRVKSA